MDEPSNPLLTDLYQLNMMQAYSDHGDTGIAVFEFFMRKLPARRGFLMAGGLEPAVAFLEQPRFSPRGRAGAGARLSGEPALLAGGHRVAGADRTLRQGIARRACAASLYGRRTRH